MPRAEGLRTGQGQGKIAPVRLGANQLLGDFADSPVVQDETQLFFLSAVTYSF